MQLALTPAVTRFLAALAAQPGPWVVREGMLQVDDDWHTCPVCAVAGDTGVYFWVSGPKLGLSDHEAEVIAMSADDISTDTRRFDPALRQQLLKATVERDAC